MQSFSAAAKRFDGMGVKGMTAPLLAITLSVSCIANLSAQSGGHDLPPGFRSLAGVTLNQDSATTIRAKLGSTRVQRIGGGHTVFVRWCYAPTTASPRALLELLSDASDKGTPGQALNVIRLRADAPRVERAGCARLHASADLSTPAGLRLGLSAATIEKLLGSPSRRAADSLIYYFDAKEFLRIDSPEYEVWNTPEHRESCFDAGAPYANVAAAVIVVLRDDRATEFRIERFDQSVC